MDMKTCTKCHETKPLDAFTWRKDARYWGGGYYVARCKTCMSDAAKAWQQANAVRAHAKQIECVVKAKYGEKAVPGWYDQAKAREIYEMAAEFRTAGFKVDVDHIVPLRGDRVCGLHWHGNLRVCLTGHNREKRNRMSPHHGPLAPPVGQTI